MKLKDEVAIVSGSSRGIGRAIALELAKEGANVVVNYFSHKEAAEDVAKEIQGLSRDALAIQANVANFSEVKQMVKMALEEFGRIDILVNNAGIVQDTLVARMRQEDWEKVIQVNLNGAFNCVKAVISQMMRQRKGRIINIASIIGEIGNPGQANYAAAKAGLIGFTKSVAKEYASRNILVNAINPGYIETEMTENTSSNFKDSLLSAIPLGRPGKPEEVARAVVFLAADATYITGACLNVSGGLLI